MRIFLAASSVFLANASIDMRRHLSQEQIAGYEPASQVTDHNAIDLDQKAIEGRLALATEASFEEAEDIYLNGGHSKSYALVELTPTLSKPVSKGTIVSGTTESGAKTTAKFYESYDAGMGMVKLQYQTTDIQESYVTCRVGALPPVDRMLTGCFAATGSLIIDGDDTDYTYEYDPEKDNNNGRTIAAFSTAAESKMLSGCPGCPYAEFIKYYNYYGRADYAHEWVTAAFDAETTSFTNGNADFSKYGFIGRAEAIKKGTAYMNVYMYVIREFEDALDDCNRDCIACNDDPVHAWDEGVAFYTGSLEGVDGSGSGRLIHSLADKRCANFKTCSSTGDKLDGQSKVNYDLFSQFILGKYNLLTGNCAALRPSIDRIVNLMSVPLIQGTLRYAHKVDKLSEGEKGQAEGAVFAAAVLPRVHACSPEDAAIIYSNMGVGAISASFEEVKAAFERNYECMGITCAEVGGLWNGIEGYYEGAEPCIDKSTGSSNKLGLKIALPVGLGVAAGIFFLISCYMFRKERQGKPVFIPNTERPTQEMA